MPTLEKIDHIHIYAPNRLVAEKWYQDVLGFTRVKSLESWFSDGGPLTISNGGGHLALFEHNNKNSTVIAFAVDETNYHLWKEQLTIKNIFFIEDDHDLSWSLYFSDPYGNPYEITSYCYDEITKTKMD
jgi:catechol-2,3-dioxygenase